MASAYFNQTIMLILGAFLVDMCIEESGLGSRLGLNGLKAFGNRPVALLSGFCMVAWLMSSICNNTSMTMMLLPFGLSIIEGLEKANEDDEECMAGLKRFQVAVLLGISYGASIGGMSTTISASANALLASEMESVFGEVTTLPPRCTR